MGKRTYISAVILLWLVCLAGCSKSSTQSANGAPADEQASSVQTTSNPNTQDNLPAQPEQSASQVQRVPLPARIVLPAGTAMVVRLQHPLSSASSKRGERFNAVLEQPLIAGDRVVVPAGTMVEGHVVSARHSGRLHHPGALGLTLDSMVIDDRYVPVATSEVVAHGGSHKKRNWGYIGGGTGGGAVIGALAAGGQGALIGSGIGAVAGTTTAFITGKKDVRFSNEKLLQFRLDREVDLS